jgi:NAD(P)-dependent dehydrogenase (short-subunit alcohol dehydrogenase family)
MATAIVTGASKGLGKALAAGLAGTGWSVVIDARHHGELERSAQALLASATRAGGAVVAITGDVADPNHQAALVAAAAKLGGLDLLVNNAGVLGPSPLPRLERLALADLRAALEANTVAPLGLIQRAGPLLDRSAKPRVVNITSDAALEAYPGWGAYGATKAALEHLSAVLAAERPRWQVWAVDPGDLRTDMHQAAFPGEDISDRPEPETVVPAFLELVASNRPSGRLRLAELQVQEAQR